MATSVLKRPFSPDLEHGWIDNAPVMRVPSSFDMQSYCEKMEKFARDGAGFWRDLAGVSNKAQARQIPQADLEAFLKQSLPILGEQLLTRSGVAFDQLRANVHNHLTNAFPTLEKVGIKINKGTSTLRTSAYSDPDAWCYKTMDLEGGATKTAVFAWFYGRPKDIADATKIEQLAIADGAHLELIHDAAIAMAIEDTAPRQVGFTPRDIGLTASAVEDLKIASYWHGFYDAVHGRTTIYPPKVDTCNHVGLSIEDIDSLAASFID